LFTYFRKKKIDQNIAKLLIAAMVGLLFYILKEQSTLVESLYATGVFSLWRYVWDYTFGWSPVPLVYFFILLLLYMTYRWIRGLRREHQSIVHTCRKIIKSVFLTLCLLYSFFYLAWGFNYKRVDQIDQLLDSSYVDQQVDELFGELEYVSDHLSTLRSTLADSIDWHEAISGDDDIYRPDLVSIFNSLDVPHAGRVRVRMLYPKGSLLYWSTAGVYLPFVSEGHVDAGLHPITWPYTILHEMSHGYGQTGEDDCNFWALLACVNSKSLTSQYSGYMAYWRYLRSSAYRVDKERFQNIMSTVNPLVLNDLSDIISYSRRYPDIMPRLRDLVYDQYLKSHGVSEGLLSYNRVVLLALSWQEKYGTLQLKMNTQGQ
jgi:hypothetical protein